MKFNKVFVFGFLFFILVFSIIGVNAFWDSDFGNDDWGSDFSQDDSWDSDFGEDDWGSDFSQDDSWDSDFEEGDEGFGGEETGDYFDWYDDYPSDEFVDEPGDDLPEGPIFDKDKNNPPVILSEPVTVAYVGEEYHYQVVAHDPDGDKLTYKLDHAPEGMTIDAESGLIKWTPAEEGEYYVRVVVVDGNWGLDAQDFMIDVIGEEEENNPPVILSEPVTVAYVGEEYHYQVVAHDPDGDKLTYKLDHAPEGMTIDAESGLIKWTPAEEGEYYVRVVVVDGNWGLDAQDFMIDVIKRKEEPALVLGNLYVDRIYLPDTVKAGDMLEIGFKLENMGSKELDDVSVLVLIPELGIGRRIGPFDLKGHKKITKWAFIEIPDVEGEFAIRLSFSNDNLRRTIFRDVIIEG